MAITFEDLQKANESIRTTNIKGKEYAEVNQRIKAFRMVYPEGFIKTEMLNTEYAGETPGMCVIHATCGFYSITDTGVLPVVLGEGYAHEKESSSFINKTSYIENCETSAVGRALGMTGFGIDTSVCSAEELTNAINNQKSPAWEEKKNNLVELAAVKGIAIEEVLKVAKVNALENLNEERLDGAIAWLAGK